MRVFLLYNSSKILIARLAPSCGSVPEPSSSSKTKLLDVALFKIFAILLICEEKVLKDS